MQKTPKVETQIYKQQQQQKTVRQIMPKLNTMRQKYLQKCHEFVLCWSSALWHGAY